MSQRRHPPRRRRPIALAPCAILAIAALAAACYGDPVGLSPTPATAPASATARAPVTTPPPGSAGGQPPSSPSPIATPQSAQAMLDDARLAYGAPGALAVVRRGDARTWLASGSADTAGTRIDESTRFRIASITKPIVSALVLDAVARGEVGLDDVVGEVLPGVLRPDPPVTVRQLLDHTSGIFDESNGVATQADVEADIARLADPALREEATSTLRKALAGERAIASDRVIVALSETHDRYFAPGTGYHYSNTNYQLAAMVLERVTGKPLADLLRTRLVQPLGLRHTTIAPPETGSPELRGYQAASDGSLVDVTDDLAWFGNGGNGGIVATADDLLAMLRAIVGGRYLPPDLTQAMLTPSKGSYALGIGDYPFRCGIFWGHQGSVNGTVSIAVVSPDGTDGAVVAFNLRGDGGDPNLVGLAEDLLCGTG